MKRIGEMRVAELRSELEKRGLDKSGVKAVLVERLKRAYSTEGTLEEEDSNAEMNGNNTGPEESHVECTQKHGEEDEECAIKESACNEDNHIIQDDDILKMVEAELGEKEEELPAPVEKDAEDNDVSVEDYFSAFTDELNKDLEKATAHLEEEARSAEVEGDQKQVGVLCAEVEEENMRSLGDDSINLMLEDDDKMLDYEENDRTDMEDDSAPEGDKDLNEDGESKGSGTNSPSETTTDGKVGHARSSEASVSGAKDSKDRGCRSLWVSGLSSSTRAQHLKVLLSRYGKVVSAKIVTNAKTPGAKCYGFVTMACPKDVQKCIDNVNRTELHGKIIQVERAKGHPGSSAKLDSTSAKSAEAKYPLSERNKDPNKVTHFSEMSETILTEKHRMHEHRNPLGSKERGRSKEYMASRDCSRSKEKVHNRLGTRVGMKDRLVDKRSRLGPAHLRLGRKPNVLNFSRIAEEREKERIRNKYRVMREEERRRKHEDTKRLSTERRLKEEAERIHRERERLRIERERIERQKQELLRIEREQQRLEREKREREEMQQEVKSRAAYERYQTSRQSLKRSSHDERVRKEYYEDRKRMAGERSRYEETHRSDSRYERPGSSSHGSSYVEHRDRHTSSSREDRDHHRAPATALRDRTSSREHRYEAYKYSSGSASGASGLDIWHQGGASSGMKGSYGGAGMMGSSSAIGSSHGSWSRVSSSMTSSDRWTSSGNSRSGKNIMEALRESLQIPTMSSSSQEVHYIDRNYHKY